MNILNQVLKILEFCLAIGVGCLYFFNIKQALTMGRKMVPRTGNAMVGLMLHYRLYWLAMLALFAGFFIGIVITCALNQIQHPWGLWLGIINLCLFGWVRMKQVDKHAYAIMRRMSYDAKCRVRIDEYHD